MTRRELIEHCLTLLLAYEDYPLQLTEKPNEALGVEEIARAIRKHWMVGSYRWHLDVTFREDASRTLEKQAAFNQNILRKLALNALKLFDADKKAMSIRMKRFSVSTNPEKHLTAILTM